MAFSWSLCFNWSFFCWCFFGWLRFDPGKGGTINFYLIFIFLFYSKTIFPLSLLMLLFPELMILIFSIWLPNSHLAKIVLILYLLRLSQRWDIEVSWTQSSSTIFQLSSLSEELDLLLLLLPSFPYLKNSFAFAQVAARFILSSSLAEILLY